MFNNGNFDQRGIRLIVTACALLLWFAATAADGSSRRQPQRARRSMARSAEMAWLRRRWVVGCAGMALMLVAKVVVSPARVDARSGVNHRDIVDADYVGSSGQVDCDPRVACRGLRLVACSALVPVFLLLPSQSAEAQGWYPDPYTQDVIERGIEEGIDQIKGSFSGLGDAIRESCTFDTNVHADEIDAEMQSFLDCLGMLPVVGAGFDLANITYSVKEGDWSGAGLRVLFFLPVVGGGFAAVKISKGTPITTKQLKELAPTHVIPRVRAGPFTIKHTGTKSIAKNVDHVKGTKESLGGLRKQLKEKAGLSKADYDYYDIDHSVPRSLGGTNARKNLRVVSKEANNFKSALEDLVVKFKEANPDLVADFVVDHGTKHLKPKAIRVTATLNGFSWTVEIPNVVGPNFTPRLVGYGGTAARAAGETGRLLTAVKRVVTSGGGGGGNGSVSVASAPATPTLSISTVSAADRCTGCYWLIGTGTNWEPHSRFHITCTGNGETFADTSADHPVPYKARYASPTGEITWGTTICYSSYRRTVVEVWNDAGQHASVTVGGGGGGNGSVSVASAPATPTLSISTVSAADRCTGCYWLIGTGTNWEPHSRFHITCTGNGETFADTSANHPVPYKARYASPTGEITWGTTICYSSYRRTVVEVWNDAGQRASVTV